MQCKRDGVTMVWHYNAFLSYDIEPVEEERVWLDAETAQQKQVDLNAYFIANGTPNDDRVFDQMKLAGQLYANAQVLWDDQEQKDSTLDKRA